MIINAVKSVASLIGLMVTKIPKSDYKDALYESLYSHDSLLHKRFYNIGAGPFNHKYWTNVDYVNDWYAGNTNNTLKGINYDLFSLEPLPIETDSAEMVYTSHTIEHVNNTAVQNVFNEAFRVLKPGGRFRVVTQDIKLSYRAYKEDDRNFFFWIDWFSNPENYKRVNLRQPLNQESIAQIFLEDFAAQASEIPLHGAAYRISDSQLEKLFNEKSFEDALDYCTSLCDIEVQKKYTGNHINWFTEEKLIKMLKAAGFKNVYRSGYGQSYSPVMRDLNFFDETLPGISLYVEAQK